MLPWLSRMVALHGRGARRCRSALRPSAIATCAGSLLGLACGGRSIPAEPEVHGPWNVTYLKASNTDAGDRFGESVALWGDTLVVGAILEDSGAQGVGGDQTDNTAFDSGAVYVFGRANDGWLQTAYLKGSNTEEGDWFGWKVALDGDTLAVAAPFEDGSRVGDPSDNQVSQSGAVYVFERAAGEWLERAYLKASNLGEQNWFGWTLALHGDVLAVGAVGEDSSAGGEVAVDTGAVYIFEREGSSWVERACLKGSRPSAHDSFGSSLALSGTTLAVGALREQEESGAVHVFERGADGWFQSDRLTSSNLDPGDGFGWSVALAADTLVVGAFREQSGARTRPSDNSMADAGAVYVFERSGQGWAEQTYLKASNVGARDLFGWNVALSGRELAVTAVGESAVSSGDASDNSQQDSGAAYIFEHRRRDWSEVERLKALQSNSYDRFGHALAFGHDTLAVAAYRDDSSAVGSDGDANDDGAFDSGAVYVFWR